MPDVGVSYLLYLQYATGWQDAHRANKWSKMWTKDDNASGFRTAADIPEQ